MKVFYVRQGNRTTKDLAAEYVQGLPSEGVFRIEIKPWEETRSVPQNDTFHMLIGQIRKSGKFIFMDRADWSEEDIKRLLIDAFAQVRREEGRPLRNDPRMVPSIDGQRMVQLNVSSSGMAKAEANEFIEFLLSYMAALGVDTTDLSI